MDMYRYTHGKIADSSCILRFVGVIVHVDIKVAGVDLAALAFSNVTSARTLSRCLVARVVVRTARIALALFASIEISTQAIITLLYRVNMKQIIKYKLCGLCRGERLMQIVKWACGSRLELNTSIPCFVYFWSCNYEYNNCYNDHDMS